MGPSEGLTFNSRRSKRSDDGSPLAFGLGALIGGASGILFGGTVGDDARQETWRVLPVGRRHDPRLRAANLARSAIIVDGHLDVPYRLQARWEDVSTATAHGNFDYPRAVAGGLDAPFMAIYTPSDLEAEGLAKERADELIDMVWDIAIRAPDRFNVALSANAVRRNHLEWGYLPPDGTGERVAHRRGPGEPPPLLRQRHPVHHSDPQRLQPHRRLLTG